MPAVTLVPSRAMDVVDPTDEEDAMHPDRLKTVFSIARRRVLVTIFFLTLLAGGGYGLRSVIMAGAEGPIESPRAGQAESGIPDPDDGGAALDQINDQIASLEDDDDETAASEVQADDDDPESDADGDDTDDTTGTGDDDDPDDTDTGDTDDEGDEDTDDDTDDGDTDDGDDDADED